jgi:hypothetical protein
VYPRIRFLVTPTHVRVLHPSGHPLSK